MPLPSPSFATLRPHLLPVLVLLAVTVGVYGNTLNHEFLLNWDDNLYVVENEAVRGLSWEHVREAFTRFYIGNYAPLHIISYMADYTLWGLRPAGFLASNILIHAGNGLLLYALLYRLYRRKTVGFVAASVFLLHPVQVESVAWISQRKNLLALFFFLLSFHLYVAYRTTTRGRSSLYYLASLLAFVLALLSKSVAIILPLCLVLYDLCCLDRSQRKSWLGNKLLFLGVAGAALIITMNSQLPENAGGRISYAEDGPFAVFFTMLTVLVRYLHLLFWPTGLSAIYLPPMKTSVDAAVAGSALLALSLVGLGGYLYRRNRALFFWYALFFIGLLPVSQIIPIVTWMNDRYLYFPLVGAAALYGLLTLPAPGPVSASRHGCRVIILVLLLTPLPWLSWQRAQAWSNDTSLWLDTTRKTPNSPLAWNGLGMAYVDAGRSKEAAAAFLQALAADPNYSLALINIGALYNSWGNLAAARPYLLRVTELSPDDTNGLLNLGLNYYLSDELPQAEQTFQKILALEPQSPQVLAYLGDIYLKLQKFELARRYQEAAAELEKSESTTTP